jgi:hemolysin activation/secretion protein
MTARTALRTIVLSLLIGPVAAQEPESVSTFDILEFRVLGVTQLPQADIERAVYPFLGPGRSISSVEEARQALERAYHDRGLGTVFADIPEQDIAEGIVRLRVTEGRIDRVRIAGTRYFSNQRIRERLPSLQHGNVPQLPQVQAELNALNNQTRDRNITPVLKAGRTPGTVDVDLKVTDELPLHGSLEVNDRYTADTTRMRIGASLSYDNLFDRRHSLSLQFQTAPEEPSEAQVLAATYVAPLGESGRMLALYGVDTNSDVATVGTLSVLGKGQIFGARLIQPLSGSPTFSQSFSGGVDYKDFAEQVRLTSDSMLDTPISYLNAAFEYSGALRGEATSTAFTLGIGLGLRGAGGDALEFENKRFLARPNYFHLRGSLRQERELFAGLRLFGRLSAQYSPDSLVSNEQFAIGGADSVRGYLESESLGDIGASTTLELRSSQLLRWAGEFGARSHVFGFIDGGLVQIHDPLPKQARSTELASWGLGLRTSGYHGLDTDLTWGYPLLDGAHAQKGESRLHFLMRYSF